MRRLISLIASLVCRNDLVLFEVCLDHMLITVVQKVLLNAHLKIWFSAGADRLKESSDLQGRTRKRKAPNVHGKLYILINYYGQ